MHCPNSCNGLISLGQASTAGERGRVKFVETRDGMAKALVEIQRFLHNIIQCDNIRIFSLLDYQVLDHLPVLQSPYLQCRSYTLDEFHNCSRTARAGA